jgi:hypothetical protein
MAQLLRHLNDTLNTKSMRYRFFIIPAALIFQVAGAQNSIASFPASQGTATTTPATSSATVTPVSSTPSSISESTQTPIMDYKSVYEAATLEEEVQMATERFHLTQAQQEIWQSAATDRRIIEKQVYAKLDSKDTDYSKDAVYRALRTSHNNFYEAIVGYLNPNQKQALEFDRAVIQEKHKRLAKLPPPPPPAPTVTVAPVDSAAIKQSEKAKATGKKSKKKRKAGA